MMINYSVFILVHTHPLFSLVFRFQVPRLLCMNLVLDQVTGLSSYLGHLMKPRLLRAFSMHSFLLDHHDKLHISSHNHGWVTTACHLFTWFTFYHLLILYTKIRHFRPLIMQFNSNCLLMHFVNAKMLSALIRYICYRNERIEVETASLKSFGFACC